MEQTVSLEALRGALGEDQSPIVVRTSDRILFKRCRRLWGWMSHLRQGRTIREQADYLWFGTGIHYALEDYHGLNLYGHPTIAFLAYIQACRSAELLPATWLEHQVLGCSLMSYYADHWLLCRDPLATLEIHGIPQVEVNGAVDLGVTVRGRRVLYGFTLDRVIADEWGRLWVVEYKTAKQIRIYHLDVDEQVTAYCWAAWKLYGLPVAGVVYMQFRKQVPNPPKVLATGKVSTDLRQSTSAAMYAKTLCDMYGEVSIAPPENIACYNKLLAGEDEDSDRFITRHRVERNERQLESFEQKVLMELGEYTSEDLPLYPNATRDCDYMCPLQAACIAVDDGSDWERIINAYSAPNQSGEGVTQREKEQMRWRNFLPEPNEVEQPQSQQQYDQLLKSLAQRQGEAVDTPTPEEAFLDEIGL